MPTRTAAWFAMLNNLSVLRRLVFGNGVAVACGMRLSHVPNDVSLESGLCTSETAHTVAWQCPASATMQHTALLLIAHQYALHSNAYQGNTSLFDCHAGAA